jgi:hypothetical protein
MKVAGQDEERCTWPVVTAADRTRPGLADQTMVGKIGRVTGRIAPKELGEVFAAYASDIDTTIERGTRIVVVEYFPPRTVVVTPM